MKKIVLNAAVLTPQERCPSHAVVVDAGQIEQILPVEQLDLDRLGRVETIDAGGLAVTPGLIDIHTYGCLGAQLTDPHHAAEDLQQLSDRYARFGVTGFLISPPMSPMPQLVDMLRAIAGAIPGLKSGAACLGIHLEGPFLDPRKKGAFPLEALKSPGRGEIERLVQAASGWLKVVTMAPDLEGVPEAARFLAANGIRVSLGHSSLSFDQASRFLAPQGDFSLVTHIFNAMSPFQHREPGVAGAAMLSGASLMLICDGVHVSPAAVRLLVRACGVERIILVTDANGGAGLGDGELVLNGQKIFVKNGRAALADGTLAGSVLTHNQSVLRACSFAGISTCDALKMAALNPARALGWQSKGVLITGADADLAIMDERSGDVKLTMVAGKVVYQDLSP